MARQKTNTCILKFHKIHVKLPEWLTLADEQASGARKLHPTVVLHSQECVGRVPFNSLNKTHGM